MLALWAVMIVAQASLYLQDPLECPALESTEGLHCYGLDADEMCATAAVCNKNCCDDSLCEAWQFNAQEGGCFRGRPHTCQPSPSSFAKGAVGAWVRKKVRWGGNIEATHGFEWEGDSSAFNTFECVDPYACGADTQQVLGPDGETFLVRRHGPGPLALDVSVTCWSRLRTPDRCCRRDIRQENCWTEFRGSQKYWDRCCGFGASELIPHSVSTAYDVFLMISADMLPTELQVWDSLIPKVVIEESAFAKKRQRWAVGRHESKAWCPHMGQTTSAEAAAVGGIIEDGPAAVRMLVHQLNAAGVLLSRTFINIGAGTCRAPDPLYQLAYSSDGLNFAGLAVEANAEDLDECIRLYASSGIPMSVSGVNMIAEPLTVATSIRPHLTRIFNDISNLTEFGQPLHLDVLVVDIDGCDCLVAEELLQIVQPKILVVEIAFHIPPPFRFSAQYDAERSAEWQANYDVNRFNPASGCSLSFAIHQFKPYGYFLSHLTEQDAVFVHSSVAPVLEKSLDIKLPQDEFSCYRQSRLWMQMPSIWVREWFFANHPADSLGRIWANLTRVNKMINRADAPFSLDF